MKRKIKRELQFCFLLILRYSLCMFCMLAMSACWNAGSGVKPLPSPSTIPSSESSESSQRTTIWILMMVKYWNYAKKSTYVMCQFTQSGLLWTNKILILTWQISSVSCQKFWKMKPQRECWSPYHCFTRNRESTCKIRSSVILYFIS